MKVLIVVDMQNDFIDGALGTPEAVAIVPNVKKKIKEYRQRNDTIVFTQDTHLEENYSNTHEGKFLPIPHCIYGTYGREIYKNLDDNIDIHLDKFTFGYIEWDYFNVKKQDEILSLWDFDEIEIIGLCTDICVISNALIIRSESPDVDITVDASCCAGTTPERHKAALEVMKSCHINVIGE